MPEKHGRGEDEGDDIVQEDVQVPRIPQAELADRLEAQGERALGVETEEDGPQTRPVLLLPGKQGAAGRDVGDSGAHPFPHEDYGQGNDQEADALTRAGDLKHPSSRAQRSPTWNQISYQLQPKRHGGTVDSRGQ